MKMQEQWANKILEIKILKGKMYQKSSKKKAMTLKKTPKN